MDFLKDFGVKPILLAAQVVNFLLLLFILKKFLYGPILKVLDERRKKIEESLRKAEEIDRRLKEIAEREAEVILKSAREGEKIINEARDYASALIEDGREEYQRLVNKGVEDGKRLAELGKENLMQDLQKEFANVVMLAVEKVTGKILKQKDQRILIEKAVKEFKS